MSTTTSWMSWWTAIQYSMQTEMERQDLVRCLRDAMELADWAIGFVEHEDREIYAQMRESFATLQEKASGYKECRLKLEG